MMICSYEDLAKRAGPGRYFDVVGMPCGLAMEMVPTKGGTKLLCPVHDRPPYYVQRNS